MQEPRDLDTIHMIEDMKKQGYDLDPVMEGVVYVLDLYAKDLEDSDDCYHCCKCGRELESYNSEDSLCDWCFYGETEYDQKDR